MSSSPASTRTRARFRSAWLQSQTRNMPENFGSMWLMTALEITTLCDLYTTPTRATLGSISFCFPRTSESAKRRSPRYAAHLEIWFLNVDSDTTIAPDVITKLVPKMQDPTVGAAMGQLTASNRLDTWLTRLIDMEYWLACNEERAAQARFGAVMCCCGPCAMYRRSALLLLLDQYESQFFRGKPSDFGEDRHLTILMLKAGFRTEYVSGAIAATVVPNRLGPYLRQQLRWARSTFRDTLLGLRLLPGLDRYLTLDVVGQNLGPLLLALSVLTALAQLALTATVPWWVGLMIVSMTLIRCSVVALRSRQLRFLGFSLHTFINILLLLPVKAYALCTLSNSDWLSRGSAADGSKKLGEQASIQTPFAGSSTTEFSGHAPPLRRLNPARDSSRLMTSGSICSDK